MSNRKILIAMLGSNLAIMALTIMLLGANYINSLFAAPMLMNISFTPLQFNGFGGGVYQTDWGTDTSTRKKGGIFVALSRDTSSSDNPTINNGTNYRLGNFIKNMMLGDSVSAGCNEIAMPYDLFGKNYSSANHDNYKFNMQSYMAMGARWNLGISRGRNPNSRQHRNRNRDQPINTDGNDGGSIYGYVESGRGRNYLNPNMLTDNETFRNNYGIPLVCVK